MLELADPRWLLVSAAGMSLAGTAWLALAIDTHWQQVRGDDAPPRRTVRLLRTLGSAALLGSLLACLRADHPTMAALTWVMLFAACALAIAFALAWRPSVLAPLVGWVRPRRDPRRPASTRSRPSR